MAAMERGVPSRPYPGSRRLETKAGMGAALTAWAMFRNAAKAGTRWRFTTADARVKLRALSPLPELRTIPDTDR